MLTKHYNPLEITLMISYYLACRAIVLPNVLQTHISMPPQSLQLQHLPKASEENWEKWTVM